MPRLSVIQDDIRINPRIQKQPLYGDSGIDEVSQMNAVQKRLEGRLLHKVTDRCVKPDSGRYRKLPRDGIKLGTADVKRYQTSRIENSFQSRKRFGRQIQCPRKIIARTCRDIAKRYLADIGDTVYHLIDCPVSAEDNQRVPSLICGKPPDSLSRSAFRGGEEDTVCNSPALQLRLNFIPDLLSAAGG